MSKTTTLILAAILCVLVAVAMFVSTPSAPPSPVPALFLEFNRSEVKAVEVKGAAGPVRLERDPREAERWRVLAGKTLVRADTLKVEDILNDLSRMAPKNFWPAREVKPAEKASWGLEKPATTVTLVLEGRTVVAAFGGRTLERQNAYAEKDGTGDVFVVPIQALERLEKAGVEDLRERRPLGFTSSETASLSVRRADGCVLEASRASSSTWEIAAPFKGPADPVKFEEFLGKVLGVEVADFVSDGAPDPDRYGFNEPRAVLTVRREGREAPVVIKVGKEGPDGKSFFMEEGEPSVWSCRNDLPSALAALDPAALRDRNLLRIGWAKIDAVEFAHPERGWKLLRVLDRWDLEKPERVPAETGEVDRLLEMLRKVEVVKFLDGEDPAAHGLKGAEDAAARLVLTGTDPSGTRTLLLGGKDAGGNVPVRLLPPPGAKDDPPVATIAPDLLDALSEGWLAWKDREVLRVDPAEVRGIARRTAAGEESFVRDPKANAWRAVEGGKEPDGEALTRIMAHLIAVRCSGYEAKTREGLEKWGLGENPAGPAITLRLGREGEKEERSRTLVLGAPVEGGGSHYARLADGDLVFRLPDHFVNGADVIPFHEYATASWAKAEPGPGPEPKPEPEQKPAPEQKPEQKPGPDQRPEEPR